MVAIAIAKLAQGIAMEDLPSVVKGAGLWDLVVATKASVPNTAADGEGVAGAEDPGEPEGKMN